MFSWLTSISKISCFIKNYNTGQTESEFEGLSNFLILYVENKILGAVFCGKEAEK
jgi:hypothetical protein